MLECCSPARLTMNHNDRKESGISLHGNKYEMKSKSYKGTDSWNHYHHGSRNSSDDPGISSSRADKHVQSNARNHPQAEGQGRSYGYSSSDSSQRKKNIPTSNHLHNHIMDKQGKSKMSDPTPYNGKRRRSHEEKEDDDPNEEDEGEWTKHVSSSSGRTYYYNKKLDKSQWEPPKASAKKPRVDSATPSSSHSKSSNHEGRGSRPENSRRPEGTRSSRGSSRERGYTHTKEKSRRDMGGAGGDRDLSSSGRRGSGAHERGGGGAHDRGGGGAHHESSRKRHRDSRRSLSHSNSSSPVASSKYHGSSRGHTFKGSLSHSKVTPSGRSHGNNGTRDRGDKSRQTTPSCPNTRSSQPSPSASSTPRGSVGTPGIQLISPTTPGSAGGNIPASLSQTLSNTQHLIEQNSLLIEQRQRFLTGENVTMATPTLHITTPASTPNVLMSTPPTHLQQPVARKKLSLNPQQSHSPPGTVYSATVTTPTCVVGVPYTPTGTPAQTSVGGVPTTPQSTPNLHPLQKALLLHNQQQLQLSSQPSLVQPQQMTTPTPYPSGGTMDQHATSTPIQHATPTAIQHATPAALPHHMTSLSHPSSPGLQSPLLAPPETPPLVSANIHPLTSGPQTIFNLTGALQSPEMEGVIAVSSYPLVKSALLQRPVSRLGYPGVSLADMAFPGSSYVEEVGMASRMDTSLVDRGLLGPWALQMESSVKQVDQCKLDGWRRRVVDSTYHSGRLATRRLSLESAQVRTFSRGQRLACVQSLLVETEKR